MTTFLGFPRPLSVGETHLYPWLRKGTVTVIPPTHEQNTKPWSGTTDSKTRNHQRNNPRTGRYKHIPSYMLQHLSWLMLESA